MSAGGGAEALERGARRAGGGGPYGSMGFVPDFVGWWAGRTDPQRIDLYTRWSFYGTIALLPPIAVLLLGSTTDARPPAAAAFVLGSVAVTVASLVLARAGLATHLEDRVPPWRPAVAATGLWAVTAAAGVAAFRGTDDAAIALPWSLTLPAIAVLIACATAWPARTLAAAGAGTAALVALVLLLSGQGSAQALVNGVLVAVVAVSMVLSFRFTVWVLDVVTQLERARDVQARLAVAEERLRFARDLHDVMGRNLSAIAVKGQLAAELVRRGRPEAVEEVADISRIAEESLREVRGVVGGYRTASLAGELAGARSVLRAAGVACTVTGDDDGAALPAPVQTALGWVVREAVTNVLRHSRATTCTITLRADGGTAELRVVNDGAAGPAGPVPPAQWGNGLTGLAERLRAAGGGLTAARENGSFRLAAGVPVGVPA